jgi:hypothetical protein
LASPGIGKRRLSSSLLTTDILSFKSKNRRHAHTHTHTHTHTYTHTHTHTYIHKHTHKHRLDDLSELSEIAISEKSEKSDAEKKLGGLQSPNAGGRDNSSFIYRGAEPVSTPIST